MVIFSSEYLRLTDSYEKMSFAYPEYPLAGIGSFKSGIQNYKPGFCHRECFGDKLSPGLSYERRLFHILKIKYCFLEKKRKI